MNLDGSKHKVIWEMEGKNDVSLKGAVHRGKVFFSFTGTQTDSQEIYVLDLANIKKGETCIFQGSGSAAFWGIGPVMNIQILTSYSQKSPASKAEG